MSRCMYHSSLKKFICQEPDSVLGTIVSSFHGAVQTTALDAWKGEIAILQDSLKEWECEDAYVIFEYDIPRLGKRIDVVLLLFGMVFCLEFKVGQKEALQSDVEQVLDYALDLKLPSVQFRQTDRSPTGRSGFPISCTRCYRSTHLPPDSIRKFVATSIPYA